MKTIGQNQPLPSTTPDYPVPSGTAVARLDRIRQNTEPEVNASIDRDTVDMIRLYSGADHGLIASRLKRLDCEWDVDRRLETIASIVVIVGLLLGAFASRWWLIVPLVPAAFLLLRIALGWFPPLPVARRFGVRSRKEIERERYALKLVRGDFDGFHSWEAPDANAVLHAIDQ
jgi:hypothetical protein